jgi:hypothetical protein
MELNPPPRGSQPPPRNSSLGSFLLLLLGRKALVPHEHWREQLLVCPFGVNKGEMRPCQLCLHSPWHLQLLPYIQQLQARVP